MAAANMRSFLQGLAVLFPQCVWTCLFVLIILPSQLRSKDSTTCWFGRGVVRWRESGPWELGGGGLVLWSSDAHVAVPSGCPAGVSKCVRLFEACARFVNLMARVACKIPTTWPSFKLTEGFDWPLVGSVGNILVIYVCIEWVGAQGGWKSNVCPVFRYDLVPVLLHVYHVTSLLPKCPSLLLLFLCPGAAWTGPRLHLEFLAFLGLAPLYTVRVNKTQLMSPLKTHSWESRDIGCRTTQTSLIS